MFLEKFFNPQSVAIIGASVDEQKVGGMILKNILKSGYLGEIYPINPKYSKIKELACFSSIKKLPNSVDLVVIAIPAARVTEALRDCVGKTENVVVVSAGFSEVGSDGKKLEEELKVIAKEGKLNLLGPNCMGVMNVENKLNATFGAFFPVKGGVSLVTQSGAFVSALLDFSQKYKIGYSKLATIGNKAVLDEVDFLEYLSADKNTKVIGFYLESIVRGKEFIEKIKKVSKKKPVLIFKAGNGQRTNEAILSHTGAMAGESVVAKAAIESAGGLYFDRLESFLAALRFFASGKKVISPKILILTNAGGPGVVATDMIESDSILELAEVSPEKKEQLAIELPKAASLKNPIDLLGDALAERYQKVLNIFANDKASIVGIITRQAGTDLKQILKVFAKASKKKATVPIYLGGKVFRHTFSRLADVFEGLRAGWQYSQMKNRKEQIPVFEKLPNFQSIWETKIKNTLDANRKMLTFKDATELVSMIGLDFLESFSPVEFLALEKKSFPVVLKIDDDQFIHKEQSGGLVFGIVNQDKLEAEIKKIRAKFGDLKLTIQPQVEAGLEVIVGAKIDPIFGPVLMCGLGGIFTELIDEKNIFVFPIEQHLMMEKLSNSKLAKIMEKKGIALESLIEVLKKVANLVENMKGFSQLDINPIFFYPDKNPLAIDIKIILP